MIESAAFAAIEGIRHGFFTRRGGVSEGLYTSLNCGPGSDDVLANVTENRARAMARLGAAPETLCTLHQVHGSRVVVAGAPWSGARADAMVTTKPGLTLGILTADCVPVLMVEARAGVIAAAHAGWKGAVGGVIAAAIDAMCRLGAERGQIAAALGPAIAQVSYEIGPEVQGAFIADDPANARFFKPSGRDGHYLFDLAGQVAAQLEAAGIGAVERLDHDTCAEEDLFFSYRRATRRGEPDYGRCLSAITLAGG